MGVFKLKFVETVIHSLKYSVIVHTHYHDFPQFVKSQSFLTTYIYTCIHGKCVIIPSTIIMAWTPKPISDQKYNINK